MVRMLVVSSLFVWSAFGCTNKFEDKTPDSDPNNSYIVSDQMNSEASLDTALNRIDESARRIRKLIQSFKKIQSPQYGTDTYTQIDFMLDLNEELKKAPADSNQGGYVREGSINLNLKGLSDECKVIKTRLETLSHGKKMTTPWGESVDGLIYSVQTCNSGNQYMPVAQVTFIGDDSEFTYNNANIAKALQDTLVPSIEAGANCKIKVDSQTIVGHVTCTNLSTRLSESENLIIDNLVYDVDQEKPFVLAAQIYENMVAKAKISFSVDQQGKVGFDVSKIP